MSLQLCGLALVGSVLVSAEAASANDSVPTKVLDLGINYLESPASPSALRKSEMNEIAIDVNSSGQLDVLDGFWDPQALDASNLRVVLAADESGVVSGNGALPNWANYQSASGTFIANPTVDGEFFFKAIYARDGFDSASYVFKVSAAAVDGEDPDTGTEVDPNPNQRFNLFYATDVPKFPVSSSLVWPSKVGDADICLWNDDKFAALSITIDDNIPGDHGWWLSMANTYNQKLTWMVVSDWVEGDRSGVAGTWDGFQAIVNAGHSVQSHTKTHGVLKNSTEEYIVDYQGSQDKINQELSGQSALTLAYPDPSAVPTKPEIAQNYYIGARGTHGTPNVANAISYKQTNSTSSQIDSNFVNSIVYGTSGISWLAKKYTRGWLVTHFHTVKDRANTEQNLRYIKSLESQIWSGLFYDVIRFAQERDTATVTVKSVNTDSIRFDLKDWMDDTIYDFPLTIKFRVDNSWNSSRANQGGSSLETWVVTHEGKKYALVKAIPDRGEIVLSKG